jgi:hypothetical protein
LAGQRHPISNAVCAGYAQDGEVHFAGACINALVLFNGCVLRTAEPDVTSFGVAQVRRFLSGGYLQVVHLVFAPVTPRPVLLSVVRLKNLGVGPVQVNYTEFWDVRGDDYRAASGACSCQSVEGLRVLGDVALAVRGNAPEASTHSGLALDLQIVLPPDSRRHLCFAYATPEPGEDAALLVRTWRGEALAELERTVTDFVGHVKSGTDAISAYRTRVATFQA